MKITIKVLIISIAVVSILFCFISCTIKQENYFPEITKVALRNVGHQLLLGNQDSTSIVKPVIALAENKYELSFEKDLTIHPDSLVNIIKNSFEKSDLPKQYLVEVFQCIDNEVAYSYEMKQNIEKGIVPCAGRQLAKGCYKINIIFLETFVKQRSKSTFIYVLSVCLLLLLGYLFYRKMNKEVPLNNDLNYSKFGMFKLYPEQNILIKETEEISLSKKECEILELLVAQPNQTIKREELTKKVWEDNGVVVGRSLDTYISKLRKKLKDDSSITITNVHGIGYKLEINSQ